MANGHRNASLNAAKASKDDEYYTQLADIEDELVYYRDHFRGKTIFLNCDDPESSNFWKWFSMRFDNLGLKKLVSTHYEPGGQSYKLEMSSTVESPSKTPLEGDGDFRSPECVALLDEADIVCTNPPFSIFREFISLLIEHEKKFLIIGNQNAISYKEFFPLLRDDIVWLGFHCGSMIFEVPKTYDGSTRGEDGRFYKKLGMVCWYTNLDHERKHTDLLLYKRYSPEQYPKYDNYDAIEVNHAKDIPKDYAGVMGVGLPWFDKFNPDQFEILGITDRNNPYGLTTKIYTSADGPNYSDCNRRAAIRCEDGTLKSTYVRILIRNKHPKKPRARKSKKNGELK